MSMTSNLQQGHLKPLLAANREIAKLRHDIRTQLNAICGYSELLLEAVPPGLPPAHRDDLEAISRSGKALIAAADELLDGSAGVDPDLRVQLARLLRHRMVTELTVVVDTAWLLKRETLTAAESGWHSDLDRIHDAGKRVSELIDAFERGEPSHEKGKRVLLSPVHEPEASDIHALPAHLADSKVLVVDDTPSNLDLLSRQLDLLGCRVSVAKDGLEALKLLTTNAFDLLLLDLYMPNLSGEELLGRIKQNARYRSIPVIMASALGDYDAVVRCLQIGADDFLPKPIDPTLLRARVCSTVERKRMHDREEEQARVIHEEKLQVEHLLHAILPNRAVRELQASCRVKPMRHQHAAVLFCDVCGFTEFSDRHEPEQVVEYLDELCEAFESICGEMGVEKIKTIGDSFMAVAGLEDGDSNPALRAVRAAHAMVRVAPTLAARWNVRAAVHVGPIVAGVVGRKKFAYDVWGDTVNVAARIESRAEPGEVWVSEVALADVAAHCESAPCGVFELKGKGTARLFKVGAP
jgi:adenylate cyclase